MLNSPSSLLSLQRSITYLGLYHIYMCVSGVVFFFQLLFYMMARMKIAPYWFLL
jgi:hypothetical protein